MDLIDIKNTLPKNLQIYSKIQKQSSGGKKKKRCSQKFCKIHRKFAKFLKTLFLIEHLWCLLLKLRKISAVQVFSPELISLAVSFSRIFSIHQEHLLSEVPEKVCYSFFLMQSVKQEFTLFTSLFQRIRRPVLVSYKLVIFTNNW